MEIVRYFKLAQADKATPPGQLDPRLREPGWRQISSPVLPMRAAATEDDAQRHLLVRVIFEDIAISVAPRVAETERLRFLAALDGLPVGHRGAIGESSSTGWRPWSAQQRRSQSGISGV